MTDSPIPNSEAEVIDLFSSRGLLAEVGLTPSHARTMKARARIPAEWHEPMVATAGRHGLPVDYALLAKLAARRRVTGRAENPESPQPVSG